MFQNRMSHSKEYYRSFTVRHDGEHKNVSVSSDEILIGMAFQQTLTEGVEKGHNKEAGSERV